MMNVDRELDVCGLSCPMPLIRLSQAVTEAGSGVTLKICGDDPVFEQGVRDYCELNRLEIISVIQGAGHTLEMIIKTAAK